MNQKWNRFCCLLFLTFLMNVSGFKGWAFLNTQPQWSKLYPYTLSPRGFQSPVIDVPVAGSIPVKAGAAFTERNQNPSRSPLSLSHQYGNYDSRSWTQAAPGVSTSVSWPSPQSEHNPGSLSSLLNLQSSSTSNVRDVASRPASRQGSQKNAASRDSSGPQSARVSAALSTQGGSGTYNGLSQFRSPSGTAVSQSRPQAPSRFSSLTSALVPSQQQFVSKQKGSGSYSGLSQSASSRYTPSYATVSSAQSHASPSTRDSSLYRQFSSGSPGPESQLSASGLFGLLQVGSSTYGSSSLRFQGTPGQFTPGSSRYVKMPQSQIPQRWQPSTSMLTPGIQTSGTAASQTSTSPQNSRQSQNIFGMYTPAYAKLSSSPLGVSSQSSSDQSSSSPYTTSSQSKAVVQKAVSNRYGSAQEGGSSIVAFSLQPQDTSSQYGPAPSLGGDVPVSSLYNQASVNRPSQFQKWQPSASRLTQDLQTSGTAASQSNSPSQSSLISSRVSSAEIPSPFVPTQGGSSSYSGSSPQSQNMFCPFMQVTSRNAKLGSSRLGA